MKLQDAPLYLVDLWDNMEPKCYPKLDILYNAKGENPEMDWSEHCLLPISAAMAALTTGGISQAQAATVAAELLACWAWKKNKIIYEFDSTLAQELIKQADSLDDFSVLPTSLLLRLPYPIIYIKTDVFPDMAGFWAWIEYDFSTRIHELRIQMVNKSMTQSIPYYLHLVPNGTLKECYDDSLAMMQKNLTMPFPLDTLETMNKTFVDQALKALQLILYLISDQADVIDATPSKPVKKPKKKGIKSGRAAIQKKEQQFTGKMVGIHVGAALRVSRKKATQSPDSTSSGSGTGAAKRSHTRRGHWHHFWRGPMNGERELFVKWVHPTIIHPENGAEETIKVFPVKK